SGPLEIKELLEDDSTADELVALFEPGGTWTQRGGTIMQGPGGELVLLRTGDEQLFISPREPACWGQFMLQSDIRVQQPEGPLDLLIGMSESYRPEDTAYIIRLGAGSRDRVELLRLGVPVVSIDRADQLPLLMPNVWYRATIERSGQVLRFTLARIGEAAQVASFTFEDTLPAFAGDARERFAVQAEAGELGLRGGSTTRRAFDLPDEGLMFSLGHYHAASRAADLRLSGLAAGGAEAIEERARLLFLRARCHERLGRMEEALRDCEDAKRTSDNSLRARVFVFASGLLTAMGDDQAALAQLNAARLNASRDSVLSSVVLHSAANRADGLARTDQPERALPYYDMVNEWALGHPGLVCYTLWRDAELRLDLAQRAEGDLPEFDPAQQRAQALENLE